MKPVIIIRSVKCLLALVLAVSIIYKLGVIVRPAETDTALNAIDTFHNMPENTLEVIAYGPSQIFTGLNVMKMYENYGIGAYNYACFWQHLNTTKLFFEDSLLTQSPKLVLIETSNVNVLLQDVDMAGEIYYTRAIPSFDGKQKYLKQCFGNEINRYLSYYVPIFAFHENWVNLRKWNFLEESDNSNFYASMGYLNKTNVTPVTIPDPSTFEQAELSEAAISVLDEIIDICNENNMDIIFLTFPREVGYAYGDAMKAYAQEKGCVYFNLYEYMDRIGLDCETDFMDSHHLNENGAPKVADFLGKYIVDNYDVTDWRTVEGNIWKQNLQ